MADRGAFSRRTALVSITLAVVLLLLVTAWRVLPRLERELHPTVGTPVPTGMRAPAPIELRPGQQACVENVVFDPAGERLNLYLLPGVSWPTPPLDVTLDAPGYAVSERVRQTERWDPHLAIPVEPPRRATTGSVCVRNAGRVTTALDATADPRVLQTRRARLDGAELATAFLITFSAQERSTPAEGINETIDRAATFSWVGPWAYWILLALVAVGVPLLILGALYRALRSPDDTATGS